MQNPYAASHEGGKRPFPGPHASGLPTGRAIGSSKRGESGEEQLRPSLPLLQSWSPAGAILLLLPPIYRDHRRRQVTAAVPSRPRSFPSHVPVTIPFLPSPPLPKGWMPSSAGAWVGGYPKTTLQGPIPPRDLGTAQCSSLGR